MSEERYGQARSLLRERNLEEEGRVENAREASRILRGLLEDFITQPDRSDSEIADVRMLLADALFQAKEYNASIEMLTQVMAFHPQRFDEAEQKIGVIRNVRSEYNTLLNSLLAELRKDPNDPDDPFDEEEALEIISRMESLFPDPDPGTARQIADNKARVKLAVDRGYRDRIIEQAHDLILQGEYLAAIDRYLTIDDIDEKGFYTRSFDLQREEFLATGPGDLYLNQVDNLLSSVTETSRSYISQADETGGSIGGFSGEFARIFPPDSSDALRASESGNFQVFLGGNQSGEAASEENTTAIGGENGAPATPENGQEPDENQPDIDVPGSARATAQLAGAYSGEEAVAALYENLSIQAALRERLVQSAQRSRELREIFPSNVSQANPGDDSEYLLYLQQFIHGPQQYDNEGIRGAAERYIREQKTRVFDLIIPRIQEYADQSDALYAAEEYAQVSQSLVPVQELSVLGFQIWRIYTEGSNALLSGLTPEVMEYVPPEDEISAGDILITLRRLAGRLGLASFALDYRDLEGLNPLSAQEALSAYNSGLDTLRSLDEFSRPFAASLDSLPGRLFEDIPEEISTRGVSAVEQHDSDRDRIASRLRTAVTGYFNDYLVFRQEDAPQRLAEAVDQIDVANRRLEGIEQDNGLIYYYPEDALQAYTDALDELENIVNISRDLNAQIDSSPDFVRNAAELRELQNVSSEVIEEARQEIDELEPKISIASRQVDEASDLLQDARFAEQETRSAIANSQYEQAQSQFDLMIESYDDSLAIQADADIRQERENLSDELGEEIGDLLVRISTDRKREALASAKESYDDGDYAPALNFLADAREYHEVISPDEPDPSIEYLEELIVAANSLAQERELSETDPLYPTVSSYLNLASSAVSRARAAAERGDDQTLRRNISSAESNLVSVTQLKPSNFQAELLRLELQRLQNPDDFQRYFNDQVDEIIQDVQEENTEPGQSLQQFREVSLTRLEALDEISPGNSRITSAIQQLEVDLGIRESPQEVANRNRSENLLSQARQFYTSASAAGSEQEAVNRLENALALAEDAQQVYPANLQAGNLIDDILYELGRPTTVSLSSVDSSLLEQATTDWYVNNQQVRARNIVDQLWQDEENRRYPPLRELREEIYISLGLPLN
ncbi:hypothetical protein [Salinispira pacifica]|uniref:hypothetical protein n=1 Tax=Salinispira pacifica TaxID=1307761 RepID=UPI00059BDF5C|nr:hypothetical protein [Salinispira pacifica]